MFSKETKMAFDKKRFKAQMKKVRITQKQLAEMFDVDLRTISRWLDPKVKIKSELVKDLCLAIGSPPTDFDDKWEGSLETKNIARVTAQVSSAAKNGYWLLKKRYGVTEKEICEIAPTLFALFADSVYRGESQLEKENRIHFESLAKIYGYVHEHSAFGMPVLEEDYEAEEVDLLAQGKIFGSRELEDKYMQSGYAKLSDANHFYQALKDYAKGSKSVKLGYTPVGDCPDGRGVVYDAELTNEITQNDDELNKAISYGAIELFSSEFEGLNSPSQKLDWMKNKMQKWKKENEERKKQREEKMNEFYKKHPDRKLKTAAERLQELLEKRRDLEKSGN